MVHDSLVYCLSTVKTKIKLTPMLC